MLLRITLFIFLYIYVEAPPIAFATLATFLFISWAKDWN
jgi:hypothetical protein